ncbi:MAG: vWA domain-containing protein [Chloroflexota bacterium]
MKFAIIICLILILSLVLVACGPATNGPVQTETPVEGPIMINGELAPANASEIVSTHVEFLIDNSSSIENDCGVLGGRRYVFVNFLLDIFRRIPSSYSSNFFVGAGSFGNDHMGYKEEIPIAVSPTFKDANAPSNNKGTSQNIGDGIDQSLDRLQTQNADKRYLVIITDGKLTNADSWDTLRAELRPAIENNNLLVFVGLICPTDSTRNLWQENIANENIDVFASLEDAAQQLLYLLRPFLPNSNALTSKNYQGGFPVPGYQTNLIFRFWDAVSNVSTITLTDSMTSQTIQIAAGQPLPPQIVLFVAGCQNHVFFINPLPESHWLLFVQPGMEQNLGFLIKFKNEEPIEIVNNESATFHIEVSGKNPTQDLRLWPECFYPRLTFSDQKTGEQVNGFVTPVPPSTTSDSNTPLFSYDSATNKVSGEVIWHPPPFQEPRQVGARIQIVSLSNDADIVWEAIRPIPILIKFEAKFESYSPIVPEGTPLDIPEEFSFDFSHVFVEPRVFLITEFGGDKVLALRNSNPDGRMGFPSLMFSVDYQDAAEIHWTNSECSLSLDVPGETYACISLTPNQTLDLSKELLFRSYLFKAYNYIVSRYGFTQLLFYWDEGRIESRAITWKCPLNPAGDCVMVQPPPKISPKE